METNRPYISFSQYQLFKSSPKAFYERYVLDKKNFGTKYQNFGKKLMENLEFLDNQNVPPVLASIMEKNLIEHEITIPALPGVGKDYFGIIDGISENKKHFYEIKTGKHPWTQAEVDKNEQILFYALLVSYKYNTIAKCTLIWAETEDTEDGKIRFTGKVEAFVRIFTEEDLLIFDKVMQKTILEIDDYVHTVSDMGDDIDTRLLYLMSEQKRIADELDLLKSEMLLQIKEDDSKYASSENFNITLVKRKNWEYSKGISEEKKISAAVLKAKQAQEQKDGTAKMSITEFLMIKPIK